jgi:hypothetical protein
MSWPVKIIRLSFHLIVFLVPLIFLPNTSELFEFNKMIVTYILTAVIAAAWMTEMMLEKRFIFRRTPLDWPIIIFIGIQFSVFWHPSIPVLPGLVTTPASMAVWLL